MEIRALSPAKINLMLHVLSRREDGYHNIFSLFQRVDLSDEIIFRFKRGVSEIKIICSHPDVPLDESNLINQAIDRFSRVVKDPWGGEVRITKRIPIGGGLGGGSSNAATTLEAINLAAGNILSQQALMEQGRLLGADVPFFLYKRTAWSEGIGDELYPASIFLDFYLVLVVMPFSISTSWAYKNIKIKLTKNCINTRLKCFKKADDLFQIMSNDFEEIVIPKYRLIGEAKEALLACGAKQALMSGSGPTVYGVFLDKESAERAVGELGNINMGWRVEIHQPVGENWGVAKW